MSKIVLPPANLVPVSQATIKPLGDTPAAHRLVDLLIDAIANARTHQERARE
jgi:hypothetical protein